MFHKGHKGLLTRTLKDFHCQGKKTNPTVFRNAAWFYWLIAQNTTSMIRFLFAEWPF